MKKIGIFYGSTSGTIAGVADKLREALGAEQACVTDIAAATPADLAGYDLLIFGTSTWGAGDLQEDWADFDLCRTNLDGQQVALFGTGDGARFPDTFVDGMGILYDAVTARGAEVIGSWTTAGYVFDDSSAVIKDAFVGLAIDEDNQPELTDERIRRWAGQIRG